MLTKFGEGGEIKSFLCHVLISMELEINEHAATLKCTSTLLDAENTYFMGFLLKVQDGTLSFYFSTVGTVL